MFQKSFWRVLRLLFANLGRFRAFFTGIFIVGFLDGCLGFMAPLLLAKFTAAGMVLGALWRLIPLLALVYFVSHALQWLLRKYGESFGPEFSSELRQKYFRSLANLSLSHLSGYHSGYLLSILGAVADGLGALAVEILWGVSRGLASLLLFLYFSLEQSVALALSNMFLLVFFIVVSLRFSKGMVPITSRVNLKRSELVATYADFAANVGTVKRLGIHEFAERKISDATREMLLGVKALQSFHARRWFSLHSLFSLAMILTISFILFRISSGVESPSILILFVAAFTAVRLNAERLSENFRAVLELDTYVGNMLEVFETSAADISNGQKCPLKWETISARDLTFQHPGSSVLISVPKLEICRGQVIGISGSSGEGKTTLVNLLARLHTPRSGTLSVDDVPYGDLKEEFFSDQVLVVSQGAELFNLSVRENILLGKSQPDESIHELLSELGLASWIASVQGGLDGKIGERGVTLSEGQKQRLNLLRAYFLGRELILLDEPAAHLDEENRSRVGEFIKKHFAGKTIVLVSHQKDLLKICHRRFEMRGNILQAASCG